MQPPLVAVLSASGWLPMGVQTMLLCGAHTHTGAHQADSHSGAWVTRIAASSGPMRSSATRAKYLQASLTQRRHTPQNILPACLPAAALAAERCAAQQVQRGALFQTLKPRVKSTPRLAHVDVVVHVQGFRFYAPRLAHVDVVVQRQVQAEQPPAVGQRERKVGRLLRQQPAPDPALQQDTCLVRHTYTSAVYQVNCTSAAPQQRDRCASAMRAADLVQNVALEGLQAINPVVVAGDRKRRGPVVLCEGGHPCGAQDCRNVMAARCEVTLLRQHSVL